MLGLQAKDVIEEIEQYRPEPSDVLDRLSAALQASERLTLVGDQVVDHFVQQARAAGASWAEIGQRMGVTKQAAQKRYVAPRTDPPAGPADEPVPTMRRIVDLATQEARALGHPYVGTEHLLLATLRVDDPLTAGALAAIDIDEARALIAGTVPPTDVGADDALPLTPRSRRVLESALTAARARGQDAPDVADVVLGVAGERKGLGARLLDRLAGGLDSLPDRIQREGQSG